MPWILLIVSGLFETAWVMGLKYSDGFTKLGPSLFTVTCLLLSMGLLSIAARELPIGTAYAVWVGIGAIGATLGGIVLLGEPHNLSRLACILGLTICLIGLKLTS